MIVLLLVAFWSCTYAWAAEPAESQFNKQVAPILVGRCLECHGEERKGKLDLRSKAGMLAGGESGAAVVPGKPEESLLFQYVESGEMPPKHPLKADELKALRAWIAAGAFYPRRPLELFSISTDHRAGYDWWSLQQVTQPQPPKVSAKHKSRVRTAIDRFVLARLEQAGLSFSPAADRATLIRRVTYDLTGLLPSYEQVQAFIQDQRPDAYERVVDSLLASPRYGERWGRHWLDVVRFAESNGFERDRIRTNFWPYRDYVIRSLNDDKPYDQFVREQLAGDALDAKNPEFITATGFLVAGPKNDVGTVSKLEQMRTRQDELDEFVVATGTTFLGLTLGCARCHDHKFDPVSRHDYYSLTAVFSGLGRGAHVIASPQQQAEHAAKVTEIKKRQTAKSLQANAILEQVRRRLTAKQPAGDTLLPTVNVIQNEDIFEPVQAKFLKFVVLTTTGNSQPCLDELEVYGSDAKQNLALASRGSRATASSLLPGYEIHQIHHLNDGQLGNAHSWISNESGAGWAQIEFAAPVEVRRVVWGRDREGKYKDRLVTGYRIETSLDGKTWNLASDSNRRQPLGTTDPKAIPRKALIAALNEKEKSRFDPIDKEAQALKAELAKVPSLPTSYAAIDGPPRPAFVLQRGDVRARGDQVRPAALHAVRGLTTELAVPKDDSGPRRRLRLAEWITDPKNPLTARVFVNRVWHYHFGQGIVSTPSDFGFKGDRPSHPKLLDWLASDFVEHGWRIKRLHRMMVLSEVYRQSGAFNAQAVAQDGGNRLLWRTHRRRLDAESLRDAVLAVAGNLDLKMGGPGFRVFRYRDGNVPDYVLLDKLDSQSWRRSVYRFNIRTFQSPLMSVFDCPDPSVQTPQRASSTTALQALSLMNNQFVFSQANYFSERVKKLAGDQSAKQATLAYRLALSRDPSDLELREATEFIDSQSLLELCRVLLNTNEFLYVF